MGRRGPQPQTLLKWLRSHNPEKVICESDDGEETVVRIPRTKSGKLPRWPDAVQTIERLAPAKCRALSEDDEVLGIWVFPQPGAMTAPEPAPGYTKEPSDTPEESMLKTFAHLLADAYKNQATGFIEALQALSGAFADERKGFNQTLVSMDRAMGRLQRAAAAGVRYRVLDDEGGEGGDAGGEKDEFMENMMQMVVARMAKGDAAPTNGAADTKRKGGS